MSYYKDFTAFIWHQLVDSEWHPAKEMCSFVCTCCDDGVRLEQPASMFVYFWLDGGVGRWGWWRGGGGGCDDEWKPPARPTGIGSVSPYCPVVAKWADSSVSPCPMADTTLMRVERGTFLPCKIPKTIIIPAREATVVCNSLRRWEMTEPISAHTRPWELGAA